MLLVALAINILLLIKSKYKVKEIITPLKNICWNQSYCKTTLWLVRLVQVLLSLNVMNLTIRIIGFILSGHAYEVYAYRGDQHNYCNIAE